MKKTSYTNLPSPCWLLEESSLIKNLELLKYVKEKISWDIVAKKTLEVYKKLESRPEGKTRYIYVG